MADERALGEGEGTRRPIAGLVGAGLIGAALVAFVVQNGDSTPVTFLFVDFTAPLWVVIVASAVAGMVLAEAGAWTLRRRRRR